MKLHRPCLALAAIVLIAPLAACGNDGDTANPAPAGSAPQSSASAAASAPASPSGSPAAENMVEVRSPKITMSVPDRFGKIPTESKVIELTADKNGKSELSVNATDSPKIASSDVDRTDTRQVATFFKVSFGSSINEDGTKGRLEAVEPYSVRGARDAYLVRGNYTEKGQKKAVSILAIGMPAGKDKIGLVLLGGAEDQITKYGDPILQSIRVSK